MGLPSSGQCLVGIKAPPGFYWWREAAVLLSAVSGCPSSAPYFSGPCGGSTSGPLRSMTSFFRLLPKAHDQRLGLKHVKWQIGSLDFQLRSLFTTWSFTTAALLLMLHQTTCPSDTICFHHLWTRLRDNWTWTIQHFPSRNPCPLTWRCWLSPWLL